METVDISILFSEKSHTVKDYIKLVPYTLHPTESR